MKNIITIQHTQSIHHTNGMIGSWTDWDLSDLGVEQAKRIGERLFSEIKDKQYIIYSSDLLRAKHTAKIVAEFFNIEPILTDNLRERNLGEAVGKSVEWAHQNTIVWEKTIDDKPFIGAESRREAWNRLMKFYNEMMESADENLIIVSHGDALSIFNAIWLGLNVEMLNKCDLFGKAGGVSFMHENSDGKHIITRLSDLSYSR
ncbi:MAG TPA: histidine phosphatase family protein [Oscillospiraceae bacterium]|nr:histidine phosphatase family protein [Oscillospiraceae bacterium]